MTQSAYLYKVAVSFYRTASIVIHVQDDPGGHDFSRAEKHTEQEGL